MVYLLGVVAIAMRCSRRVSVAASFLSVAAFDFFCVPPYLTFRVSDYDYLITFAGMLVVALVISTQTARIRTQAADAPDREARTEALYRLSPACRRNPCVRSGGAAAELAEEVFIAASSSSCRKMARSRFGGAPPSNCPCRAPKNPSRNGSSIMATGRMCTRPFVCDGALPSAERRRETFGVMAVMPVLGTAFRPGTAAAARTLRRPDRARPRTYSQPEAAEEARVQMQTEELRSSLLSAVSHDLRTPLASITGAASTLRSQGDNLRPKRATNCSTAFQTRPNGWAAWSAICWT